MLFLVALLALFQAVQPASVIYLANGGSLSPDCGESTPCGNLSVALQNVDYNGTIVLSGSVKVQPQNITTPVQFVAAKDAEVAEFVCEWSGNLACLTFSISEIENGTLSIDGISVIGCHSLQGTLFIDGGVGLSLTIRRSVFSNSAIGTAFGLSSNQLFYRRSSYVLIESSIFRNNTIGAGFLLSTAGLAIHSSPYESACSNTICQSTIIVRNCSFSENFLGFLPVCSDEKCLGWHCLASAALSVTVAHSIVFALEFSVFSANTLMLGEAGNAACVAGSSLSFQAQIQLERSAVTISHTQFLNGVVVGGFGASDGCIGTLALNIMGQVYQSSKFLLEALTFDGNSVTGTIPFSGTDPRDTAPPETLVAVSPGIAAKFGDTPDPSCSVHFSSINCSNLDLTVSNPSPSSASQSMVVATGSTLSGCIALKMTMLSAYYSKVGVLTMDNLRLRSIKVNVSMPTATRQQVSGGIVLSRFSHFVSSKVSCFGETVVITNVDADGIKVFAHGLKQFAMAGLAVLSTGNAVNCHMNFKTVRLTNSAVKLNSRGGNHFVSGVILDLWFHSSQTNCSLSIDNLHVEVAVAEVNSKSPDTTLGGALAVTIDSDSTSTYRLSITDSLIYKTHMFLDGGYVGSNTAGGLAIVVMGAMTVSIEMNGVEIDHATSTGYAGGLVMNLLSTTKTKSLVSLSNCLFLENKGKTGGGMMLIGTMDVLSEYNFFYMNQAVFGAGAYLNTNFTDVETEFIENTASFFGGGLYNDAGSVVLHGTAFQMNTAATGGGVASTGDLIVLSGDFYLNQALETGHLFVFMLSHSHNLPIIRGSSFFSNQTAESVSLRGSAADQTDAGFNITLLEGVARRNMLYCPPGRSMTVSEDRITCVPCPSGTYLLGPTMSNLTTPCHPCPATGADCSEGGAAFAVLGGHWVENPFSDLNLTNIQSQASRNANTLAGLSPLTPVQCSSGYCCPRDLSPCPYTSPCAPNREGILCSNCVSNHSETLMRGVCANDADCHAWKWVFPLAFVLTALYLLFMLLPAPLFPKSTAEGMAGPKVRGPVDYGAFFKILASYYQLLPYAMTGILREEQAASFMGILTTAFSLHFHHAASGASSTSICLAEGLKATHYVWLQLLFPGLLCLWALFVLLLRICKSPKGAPLSTGLFRVLLNTMNLAYSSVLESVMTLLMCVDVKGVSRLFVEGEIKCYTSWQLLLFVVLAILALYPLALCIIVSKHKRSSAPSSREIVATIGGPFQTRTLAYEGVIMLRRLLVVGTAVFMPSGAYTLQFIIVASIFALSVVLNAHFRPWRSKAAYLMENMVLLALLAISLRATADSVYVMTGFSAPQTDSIIIEVFGYFAAAATALPALSFGIFALGRDVLPRIANFIVECVFKAELKTAWPWLHRYIRAEFKQVDSDWKAAKQQQDIEFQELPLRTEVQNPLGAPRR